ncbi:phosphatidylinositol phosphate phosphatase [Cryptococcus neoformans c45]|nr:phosphatidylinositol phosphate phosphatase [Cryptococcus neoformans var. grubii c45]
MPGALYLRPSPRAFFLVTDSHALVFRQPSSSESKASRGVVVAEFLPLEEVDYNDLIKVRGRADGVLGVVSVPSERSPIPEIFLLLLTHSTSLPPLIPSSSLQPSRIISVEFHSLSSPFWDQPELTNAARSLDYGYDDEYDEVSATYAAAGGNATQMSAAQQAGLQHPCSGMKKYLESGSFFFAQDCKWDISSRLSSSSNWVKEQLSSSGGGHPLEDFDERFVWNKSLLEPFLDFRKGLGEEMRQSLDEQAMLIPIIQGFCGSLPIHTGRSSISALGMISRLSWKRAGARFRTRGIDDDGQVANFVETEVLLALEDVCMSYVQVRGSVPLFWQQPSAGLGTLQQRVEITRPPQATQPAFDKHFLELLSEYNSIHAINLLGQKDAESMLSQAYSSHLASLKSALDKAPPEEKERMNAAPRGALELSPYDFHSAVRLGGHGKVRYDLDKSLREVVSSRERFGWTVVDMDNGDVVEEQQGVFRTNCLDCLDRTNYVQDVLSTLTITSFLSSVSSPLLSSPTLWSAHRELWADNGDRLSKIYAGTGAINTSATRSGKKTFAGLLSDATKSVGRAYINNFQDKGKQAAIDMLLGMMAGQRPVILFDPISESVQAALATRANEYSSNRKVTIFSGTWNLNGKAPNEALDSWLFPPNTPEPDIYMIAFQEIVELTAGQILQTDPAKKRMWEKFIMDTFAMRKGGKDSDYMLFRGDQLVGTALIIVVKKHLVPHIRNVESATKKTGLQGLSGNKGGVAIRLNLYDSTICFVTCHLAAGHSNVGDRNADWRTVVGGTRFLRGKVIEDHEIIIWAADFNYRVSLSNLEVRDLIKANDLDALLGADQLLKAMDAGEVFMGYNEGAIRFPPTYKYDNGTDNYDTSEKQRIPAWTDRVLFKGSSLRLQEYTRAELMTSDHRPVYAVFEATIREIDRAKKEKIAKELVHGLIKIGGEKKLAAKVGVEIGGGGARDLARGMAKVGLSSSKNQRYPPRPNSSASTSEKGSPTLAAGRIRSISTLQPPSTSASSSLRALAPSRSSSSLSLKERPTPPLPPRPNLPFRPSQTFLHSPTKPTTRLQAPPSLPPASRSRSTSHASANGTGSGSSTTSAYPGATSPAVTPSSTGDFVIIPQPSTSDINVSAGARRAPPLPPRVTPAPSTKISPSKSTIKIDNEQKAQARREAPPIPRKSLDINGSPPKEGLMSPVTPDVLKPKNILAGAAGASVNTGTRTRPIPPKPLTKTSSGSVAAMVASLNGNDKKTNDDTRTNNPQSTVTSADAEQSAGSGPGMTDRADVSTSPKSKKPEPMVPKKPATLKGAGAEQ